MADVTKTLEISDSEKPKWNFYTTFTNKIVTYIEVLGFGDNHCVFKYINTKTKLQLI